MICCRSYYLLLNLVNLGCLTTTKYRKGVIITTSWADKLFHIRPAANSTSTADPHISPEDAYAQVPRISKATGLPEYTLRTVVQFNIEKNKVSNVLVFAPHYVNVLEVNMELISGYPDVYHGFANRNVSGVS